VLLVTIRLDGVPAKPIEMRLLDDRGALTTLMRYSSAPDRSPGVDFSPSIPPDFDVLELAARGPRTPPHTGQERVRDTLT
jgi:hypothetical protein